MCLGKQYSFDPKHIAWLLDRALGIDWSVEYYEVSKMIWFWSMDEQKDIAFFILDEGLQSKIEEVIAALENEGIPQTPSEVQEWWFRWDPEMKAFCEARAREIEEETAKS